MSYGFIVKAVEFVPIELLVKFHISQWLIIYCRSKD